MSARTYRGQVRRLVREIRKMEICPRCHTRTPAGMMLDHPKGRMCSLCAVELVRGLRLDKAERRAEG